MEMDFRDDLAFLAFQTLSPPPPLARGKRSMLVFLSYVSLDLFQISFLLPRYHLETLFTLVAFF